MQNFRPKLISKIRDFGQNSAIFDSDNPREVNNEFGDTKKCFWGLWNLFGAGRKFFDHPAPKSSILGCRNFCKIAFFGLILLVFDPGGLKSHKLVFSVSKTFYNVFRVSLMRAENISPNMAQKGRFWGLRNFYEANFDYIWSENVFWTFFWISKKSYLGC